MKNIIYIKLFLEVKKENLFCIEGNLGILRWLIYFDYKKIVF